MRIERELPGLRAATEAWRAAGQRIALVPTMGALHDGHLALVAEARRRADVVIASIFVNPLQFLPHEDLDRYPRDEAGDLEKLRAAGCDLAWMPSPAVMYPPGAATVVDLPGGGGTSPAESRENANPAEGWEGDARPGHFRGVATVCTKLFLMTRADVAVFGEKDWQQLQVIRRVVADLHLPLEIVGLPTVRDTDGLALSSRNQRLSPEQRARAAARPRRLEAVAAALAAGQPAGAVLDGARAGLAAEGFGVDYLALVVPRSLRPWPGAEAGEARLLAAARLGEVRLLDNLPVTLAAR